MDENIQPTEEIKETKENNAVLPKERIREVDALGRSRASGGRKRSVASVIITPGGSGKITVNKKDVSHAFPREFNLHSIMRPLNLCGGSFDIVAKVRGGGKTGQADALRLAISLAMLKHNPMLYPTLRKEKLTTRDPRKVEPKKTGYIGARAAKPTSRR